jgi:hypothetical protein
MGVGGLMLYLSPGQVTVIDTGSHYQLVLPWVLLITAAIALLAGLVLFLAGILLASAS